MPREMNKKVWKYQEWSSMVTGSGKGDQNRNLNSFDKKMGCPSISMKMRLFPHPLWEGTRLWDRFIVEHRLKYRLKRPLEYSVERVPEVGNFLPSIYISLKHA
jgi:hypothetical protein